MFVIDHFERVSLINCKIVSLWFITHLSVVSCRNAGIFCDWLWKRMLCDVCLWLITEVYDKSQNAQKLITHKIAREFLSLSHCPCNTQWVIAEKAQILNTVCSHQVKKVGCECDCSNINSGEYKSYKSFILMTHAWSWQALRRLNILGVQYR